MIIETKYSLNDEIKFWANGQYMTGKISTVRAWVGNRCDGSENYTVRTTDGCFNVYKTDAGYIGKQKTFRGGASK